MARCLLALPLTLALLALASPAANAAQPLGLPADASVLFSLTADRGTLTPTKSKGRFVLTLRAVDRRAVWFTDRPARKTGAIRAGTLFGAWARLGFTSSAPNAVLTVLGGRRSADAVALELGTPRYDAKARTVRFAARALPGATGGLAHLRSKVDRAVPRRFGETALFIDDVDTAVGTMCTMGQASLYAGVVIPDILIPANGAALPTEEYPELYAVLGGAFGQWGSTFLLPSIPAPPQMRYELCAEGIYPQVWSGPQSPGYCTVGQIGFAPTRMAGAGWLPADGSQVSSRDYLSLAGLVGTTPENTIALPNVPSPVPGLSAYICATGEYPASGPSVGSCWAGEMQLFAGTSMPGSFTPADGRLFSPTENAMLFALLGTNFGGDGRTTFAVPNLPGPVPGTSYGVCSTGSWPS